MPILNKPTNKKDEENQLTTNNYRNSRPTSADQKPFNPGESNRQALEALKAERIRIANEKAQKDAENANRKLELETALENRRNAREFQQSLVWAFEASLNDLEKAYKGKRKQPEIVGFTLNPDSQLTAYQQKRSYLDKRLTFARLTLKEIEAQIVSLLAQLADLEG